MTPDRILPVMRSPILFYDQLLIHLNSQPWLGRYRNIPISESKIILIKDIIKNTLILIVVNSD